MRLNFKDFYIDTDEHNFILGKINVKGEDSINVGQEYDVAIGYYGTLGQALKGYLKHSLRKNSDAVKDVKRLDEIEAKIDSTKFEDMIKPEVKKKGK